MSAAEAASRLVVLALKRVNKEQSWMYHTERRDEREIFRHPLLPSHSASSIIKVPPVRQEKGRKTANKLT